MIPTKGKLLLERPLVGESVSVLERGFIVYASSEKRNLHTLFRAAAIKQQTKFLLSA
jgi:hypothetical protein